MAAVLATAPESLFFYWINERHLIYLKKSAGKSKPWSADPIFQQYKFTNPYRENDTGTIWLRENFLEPHKNDDLGLIAFNICWYRMFNWTGTGEFLGWQTDWNGDIVKYDLTNWAQEGNKVFTGAHMVRSPFGEPKIDSIVDVCTNLWNARRDIAERCTVQLLEETWKYLLTFPYVGPFMGYEMVTDMRHTRLLDGATDIMTWANPGPGAQRGLQRLSLPWRPDKAAVDSMEQLMTKANFYGLEDHCPRVEMRDIEHSLCEFDKYCRVKFGEGAPRSRYPGGA